MAPNNAQRSAHFPRIEKRYGKPIAHWLKELTSLRSDKYADQMKHLRERHGFSREHANAVIMSHRGSASSQRYATPADYFKKIDPQAAKTLRAIFRAVQAKHDGLELVIAWNQPMLRTGKHYVLGASVSKKHITLNPFSNAVVDKFRSQLKKYEPMKNTFKVPLNWKVDAPLLQRIAKARLAEFTAK